MTIEAKKRTSVTKRARMRRGSARFDADVRRGPGGEVEMIVFNKYRDSQRAPIIRVAKLGAIHSPTAGRVIVTMVDVLPNSDGQLENVAAVHIDFSEQEWRAMDGAFRFAHAEYRAAPRGGDGGAQRPS